MIVFFKIKQTKNLKRIWRVWKRYKKMWWWYKKCENGTKKKWGRYEKYDKCTQKKEEDSHIFISLSHFPYNFCILCTFLIFFCIFPTFFVLYSYFLYHSHILCTLIFSMIILTWVFSSISTLRISISSKSAIIKIIWSLMEVPFVILMFMMVFRATYLVGLSLSPNIYYKLKRIL